MNRTSPPLHDDELEWHHIAPPEPVPRAAAPREPMPRASAPECAPMRDPAPTMAQGTTLGSEREVRPSAVEIPTVPLEVPLDDAELDALFAGSERPRWRIGLGAVVVLALVVCAVVVLAIALQPRTSGIPQLGDEPREKSGAPTLTPSGAAAPPSSGAALAAPGPAVTSAPPLVVVHVAGAVQHPGVYRLDRGKRVIDALDAAGGVTPAADANALNYARLLVDGEQIFVPEPGQLPPAGASPGGPGTGEVTGAGAAGPGALVNLNTATAEQLETLPRIGPAMSQRILDYRAEHGAFTSIEQLKDISGIGDATFAGLKDRVTL